MKLHFSHWPRPHSAIERAMGTDIELNIDTIYISSFQFIYCFMQENNANTIKWDMDNTLNSKWIWITILRYWELSVIIFFSHLQSNQYLNLGWVGLWGFLWWAPSAKRTDHHGVSSGWSSIWFHWNTGLSSTQYEQIPIIFGIWPFWLTPLFFRSVTFWRVYGLITQTPVSGSCCLPLGALQSMWATWCKI